MHHSNQAQTYLTRRHLFGRAGGGLGAAALASLLRPAPTHAAMLGDTANGLAALPHRAPRAPRQPCKAGDQ